MKCIELWLLFPGRVPVLVAKYPLALLECDGAPVPIADVPTQGPFQVAVRVTSPEAT